VSVLLRPYSPYHKIDVFDVLNCIDYGDAPVLPGDTNGSFEMIEEYLAPVLEKGIKPLFFGGDHAVAFPEIRALSKVHGPLSVVHLDAHTDSWGDYLGQEHNAGTPFRRVVEYGCVDPSTSIQIGMRGSLFNDQDIQQSVDLGYEVVTTDEMFDLGWDNLVERIKKRVGNNKVFLSIDMDFVDPASAPGVQIPEAGGPTARECLSLLRKMTGINFIGADVVEHNPHHDAGDVTALLAATFGAEILALMAHHKVNNT